MRLGLAPRTAALAPVTFGVKVRPREKFCAVLFAVGTVTAPFFSELPLLEVGRADPREPCAFLLCPDDTRVELSIAYLSTWVIEETLLPRSRGLLTEVFVVEVAAVVDLDVSFI